MIIEEVSLENFLSHRHTRVELTGGINIFIGQNGSGKSSLFEAIKVAIFGPSDSDRKRLISYGEDRAKISVKFRKGEHTYTVIRELELKREKENTKSAYIDMDNERIADGSTAVSEEFQKIIGISKSAFINSVYVDQGQMDSLIKEKPAERKNIFNEIIGLKYYDRVYDIVNEIYRKMTPEMQEVSKLKDKKLQLDSEKAEISRFVARIKKDIEELKFNIEATDENLSAIQENLTTVKVKISSLDSIEHKADEKRKSIQSDEQILKQLQEKREEMDRKNSELNHLKESPLYKYGQDLSVYESLISSLETAREEEQRILKSLEQIARIEEMLRSHETQRANLEPRLKEIEEAELLRDKLTNQELSYQANAESLRKVQADLLIQERVISKLESTLRMKLKLDIISEDTVESKMVQLNAELSRLREESGKEKGVIESCNSAINDQKLKLSELSGQTLCPLCGQSLTMEHMSEIQKKYNLEIKNNEETKRGKENHLNAISKKMERINSEIGDLQDPQIKELLHALSRKNDLSGDEKTLTATHNKLVEVHDSYVKAVNTIMRHGDIRNLIAKLDRDISEGKGKLGGINREVQETSLKTLREKMQVTQETMAKMPGLEELYSQGKTYVDFRNISRKVEELNTHIQKLSLGNDEFIRISSELDSARKGLKEFELQLAERSSLMRSMKDEEERRNIVQKKLLEMRTVREHKVGESSAEGAKFAQIERDLQEIDTKLAEIRSREATYTFLEELKKAFNRDGIPRIIRERALESINSLTRNILSRFNLGIEDIQISDDLDIEVLQDGSQKNISQLSGGEKTSISIAMRMAIAKYLGRDVSTILMDEPTVYLDEERRNDLKDILQYSMKELSSEGLFPQITIITHHPELEAAADLSYHVQKTNGISEVVAID